MALLDFLKKPEPPKKEKKEKSVKKDKVLTKPQEPVLKSKKRSFDLSHNILHSPHITEKATDSEMHNKYVFKVWPKTNKIEIKKAVESIYSVDVLGVNIVNIPQKRRRVGKHSGWTKGYKKAIVTVRQGQKIEIMPR